jgi:hypothetical protein
MHHFPVDHPAFLILGRFAPQGYRVLNAATGAFHVPLVTHET